VMASHGPFSGCRSACQYQTLIQVSIELNLQLKWCHPAPLR
jgi:hypothetical protein